MIAEFYDCDRHKLDDVGAIRQRMISAAKVIGATVLGETFHKFSPQGVSGAVVIAESHLSIHTWPEVHYAAVDIFTCGGLDPRPGFDYLARALDAKSSRVQEVVRGLKDEAGEDRAWHPEDLQITTRILQETS